MISQSKQTPLPKGKRGALSREEAEQYNKENALEQNSPRRSAYSKKEMLLKELIENPEVDVEGSVEAFGTTFTVKTKKPSFGQFDMTENEDLVAVEEDHKKKMKKYLEKVKPPHENGKTEKNDDPETPKEGWEKYLEKEGVISSDNKKK